MHGCWINERNKSTSSWGHLTKNRFRFAFMFTAHISLMCGLNLCLPLTCVSDYLCQSVPNKGFALYVLNSTQSVTWETLQKSLIEFYKGLSHWFQLNSTQITDIILYQPVFINGCFQPLWSILGSCFQLLYLLLLANDTCA